MRQVFFFKYSAIVLVFAALVATSGCSSDSGDALERARLALDRDDVVTAGIELRSYLQSHPDSAEGRWLLGRSYLEIGNAAGAEKELEKALELGHEDSRALELLTRARVGRGEPGRALEALPADLDAATNPDLVVQRGYARLVLNQLEGAEADFRAVLEIQPDNAEALLGLGRFQRLTAGVEAALPTVERAYEADPDSVDAKLFLADLMLNVGDADRSLALYQEAAALASYSVAARVGEARAQLYRGAPDDALAVIDDVDRQAPGNLIARYLRAHALVARGDLEAGIDVFRDVLSKAPQYWLARYHLGLALLRQGKLEQAQENVERFVADQPEVEESRLALAAIQLQRRRPDVALETLAPLLQRDLPSHSALELAAAAKLALAQIDEADALFTRAAELRPPEPETKSARALNYARAGATGRAIEILESVLIERPELPLPQFYLTLLKLRSSEPEEALVIGEELLAKSPDDIMVMNLLAAIRTERKEFDQAERLLEGALENDPAFISARLNLARLKLARDQVDEGERQYERVLEQDSTNQIALVALARIAEFRGRGERARLLLERALAEDPGNAEAAGLLAKIESGDGNYSRAIELIEPLLPDPSANPQLAFLLSDLYVAAERDAAALRILRQASEGEAAPASTFLKLGLLEARIGHAAEAETALDAALARNPDLFEALIAKGAAALARGDVDTARALLARARERRPDVPAVIALEGDIAVVSGDLAAARERFTEALERSPRGDVAAKLFKVVRLLDGDQGALEFAAEWLAKRPQDIEVRLMEAQMLEKSGALAAARAAYEAVLERAPDNLAALNNLSNMLSSDEPDQALTYARRAAEKHPDSPYALDTLGWQLTQRGELAQALQLVERAAKALPDQPTVLYHLAVVQFRLGVKDAAEKSLERALALGEFPERSEAEQLLADAF